MGRRGGASAIDFVKDIGGKLVIFYNWFLRNKQAIHYVLKMKSINPPGYEYAQNFEKLLTSVGLGKNPGSCSCTSSGGRRRGGAYLDFDGKTSVAANVGDSYVDNEPSYGKTRRAKQDMLPPSEMGVSREEMSSPKGGRKVKGAFGEEYEVADEPTSMTSRMIAVARKGGRAPSARNLIVKKVMAEHGLSLPQASKYVKEHNLY